MCKTKSVWPRVHPLGFGVLDTEILGLPGPCQGLNTPSPSQGVNHTFKAAGNVHNQPQILYTELKAGKVEFNLHWERRGFDLRVLVLPRCLRKPAHISWSKEVPGQEGSAPRAPWVTKSPLSYSFSIQTAGLSPNQHLRKTLPERGVFLLLCKGRNGSQRCLSCL